MPPKKKKGRRAGVRYDVAAEGRGSGDAGPLAGKLAACLLQKGYCLADFGLGQELLGPALKEALRLEAGPEQRFQPPALEVADGLLGEEGSSLIWELDLQSEEAPDAPGLRRADEHLTEVADLVRSLSDDLGVGVWGRSQGLLHIAGYASDDAPRLTEAECQRWLTQFGRHRLMVILFLGPVGGTLELSPFSDEDANPVELPVEPGATVILRADALSHRYVSPAKSVALTCWLNQEAAGLSGARRGEPVVASPQYQELAEWKERRLVELKSAQVIGDEGQIWDPEVPREWQRAANHTLFSGPQVGIRSLAGKLPQTYAPRGFWMALSEGMDFAQQVPMLRWSHEEAYDPNPISWKYSKTCCQHGCFVDGLELFDSRFFGISPFEAKGMDPNQRHILETSYEALMEAGFTKKALMRSLIGVYIAAAVSEFGLLPLGPESQGATSGANSITSNRISFCLGMQGPSYTIDNQGAAALSALTAATLSLRMQTSRFKPNHTCLVGGVYIMLAGSIWVLQSSQGWLSQQGRCLAFDYSADGSIKGDGIANTVLSPVSESVDGHEVVNEGQPLLGTVAASSMSHTGRGASLTAPSGPAERELVLDAVKQASISPSDVDAVECWAEGFVLKDAVEAEALRAALRPADADGAVHEAPLAIASGKSQFGTMWEAAGMASLIRVLVGQRSACMAPCLHLCELNPHIDAWSGDEPLMFNSEAVGYCGASSYHGLTGRSIGGTMAHVITFAASAPEVQPRLQPEEVQQRLPLAFWPGGGGQLPIAAAPASARPYHLVGSWSEWATAEPMQSEGAGVYGLTVTLGPNRFEQFQVALDGDAGLVLHPAWPWAPSGSAAVGPDPAADCGHLRWTIDGRDVGAEAALVGGDSEAALEPSGANGAVASKYREPALPGSIFRVRLRVAGKWRAVDWEKLTDPDPLLAREVDDGRYYAVGSFNDWSFQDELRPAGSGLFRGEVGPLLQAGGEFQIVRNQDWSQTFYPVYPPEPEETGDRPHRVLGPAESPEELYWSLRGLRGDRFRVEFRRSVDAAGRDERSVTWQLLRRRS